MKTRFSRWAWMSVGLAVLGGVFWLAGDGLRFAAQHNLARQEIYFKGVAFDLVKDFDGTRPSTSASVAIRRLYDVGFYRKEIVEPNAVRILKEAVGSAVEGLYFPDEWQLLWYLEFTGNTNALYASIDHGLTTGVFANSTGCTRFSQCTVEDPSSTANGLSREKLTKLILDNFVDPALDDLDNGAIVSAHRRALDALQLIRRLDLDRNQSEPNYDRVLVMASFLTREDAGTDLLDIADLAELSTMIGSENPSLASEDPDIKAYVEGLRSLKNECVWDASATFAARALLTEHDPLAELFSFLSVRAIASPVIIKTLLSTDDAGTLQVTDCAGSRPMSEYLSKFEELTRPGALPPITHGGLASDIRYYEALLPSSPELVLTLVQEIETATAEIDDMDGNGDAEPPAETSPEEIANSALPTAAPEDELASAEGKFRWPLSGRILVKFADSRGTGINIEAYDGAPVHAADDGTVIYVGAGVEGYGNLILIRHPNGYVSAYAHLGSIGVAKTDVVTRGQAIGAAGATGSVARPQLHFELRKGSTPVDPVPLLAS